MGINYKTEDQRDYYGPIAIVIVISEGSNPALTVVTS